MNNMMTSMGSTIMKKSKQYSSFYKIVLIVLIVDQVTKWLATVFLTENAVIVVPYFLSLSYVKNTGAAWSMFQNNGTLLGIFGLLVLLLIFVSREILDLKSKYNQISYGLICAGIAGNIIDRLAFGSVVDFIDFQIGHYHWPVFNIADSAICAGVLLYFLFTFYPKTK